MSNETEQPEHRFAAKARELQAQNAALEVVLLPAKDRPDLDVLVRPPTRTEWRKSMVMLDDPKTRNDANAWLVAQCVLWPEPRGAEFLALAERWPAWVDKISGQLAKLVGTDIEISARKL